MENAIGWQGRQVEIECDGRILWFPSTLEEAIAAYGPQAAAVPKLAPKDDAHVPTKTLPLST